MNEKQMKDMAVSILLDEYTQLDVAQLLKEYEEAEENGELPDVPDSLDEKCTEMIRREFAKKNRKKQFVRIPKVLSKAAMIVLMLIGLCTVSVLSVTAWREPVLRFVLETFERYAIVGLEGEVSQESKTPEAIIERLSTAVPSSFKMVYEYATDGRYRVRYMGNNGEIVYLSATSCLYEKYYDTESAEGTRMQINGYNIIFVDKNGYKVICLDENQEILIEFGTVNIGEKVFWDYVYALTK